MSNKVFDGEFFKNLENISLKARMTINNGAAGGRRSKAKGSSVEFSDFREYTPGDDFRRIDWNAYGRFEKLFLKLFMEEREAYINIFLDCSKSMIAGDGSKAMMAQRLSAVFTYMALNNLDRVCINTMTSKGITPSSSFMGKGTFQQALSFIENANFNGSTNLWDSIKKKQLKSRAVSIVISDFFTEGSIEGLIKYLAFNKQQIVFIQVLTKDEISPEIDGQVRLVDSETKEEINITITPKMMKAYEVKLKALTNGMKEQLKRYGGSFVQVSSEEELQKVIFEKLSKEGII
ncbi:DUF58 domain-containing protein [Clostridium manihotivorum]|uniref:DUF58 domain-containing protein n=1 Tax=Clostridium manihotivorum TaxID=2320868 RepID=A0A410E112_9CLOT|nr:DUF58 domain-containing protein [Clostridium manihotivorum]QAA35044.1 DUF58 domain-containing protein [Clostridium manihotivorum]